MNAMLYHLYRTLPMLVEVLLLPCFGSTESNFVTSLPIWASAIYHLISDLAMQLCVELLIHISMFILVEG